MRYIVNSREMNLYDSRTIEEFHMPQAVLMERAAFSFVETLRREKRNTSRTLVVCGSGNNGGDGLACARILAEAGWEVRTFQVNGFPPSTGDAKEMERLWREAGGNLEVLAPADPKQIAFCLSCDVLI